MIKFTLPDAFKSPRRLEREQRVRARETVASIGLYVRRMTTVRARFHELLMRAVRLNDTRAVDANARVCASLDRAIARAQSLALSVEGLESLRDMTRINGEFVAFMGALSRSVADATQGIDVFSFQLDVETCMQQVDDLNAQLNQAMESVGPALETFGNPASAEEVERVAREAVGRYLAQAEREQQLESLIGAELEAIQTPLRARRQEDPR